MEQAAAYKKRFIVKKGLKGFKTLQKVMLKEVGTVSIQSQNKFNFDLMSCFMKSYKLNWDNKIKLFCL